MGASDNMGVWRPQADSCVADGPQARQHLYINPELAGWPLLSLVVRCGVLTVPVARLRSFGCFTRLEPAAAECAT